MANKDKSLNRPTSSGVSDDPKSREIFRLKQEIAIAAALDRIRSKAMSMKHSDELNDIVTTLYDEFINLNINLARCIIWIIDKKDHSSRMWLANSEADNTAESYHIPELKHKYYQSIIAAWKKRRKRWSYQLKGREKQSVDKALFEKSDLSRLPQAVKKSIFATKRTIINGSFYGFGMIEVSGPDQLNNQQQRILSRFGKVFDQCYTRFLDLQKAEAQAREAQIEAALERVRAASMAMHHSDELNSIASIIHDQLTQLGIVKDIDKTSIKFIREDSDEVELWETEHGGASKTIEYAININDHRIFKKSYAHWKSIKNLDRKNYTYQAVYENKDLLNLLDWSVKNQTVDAGQVEELLALDLPDLWVVNSAYFSNGAIDLGTYRPLDDSQMQIIKRFAAVFEQAYTRFLDLQKAETQSREARIEAALERVRAASMAMHKSEDLAEVAYILFNQLRRLDINVRWAWFSILNQNATHITTWYTEVDGQFNNHPLYQAIEDYANGKELLEVWQNKKPHITNDWEGKELVDYVNMLGKDPEFKKGPSYRVLNKNINGCLYQTQGIFKYGFLGYSSFAPRKTEDISILSRFASVFEQTYTRFLDLQKAEAQARESQIEAALERVRSASMAMHESKDLYKVNLEIYSQLVHLNINPNSVNLMILKEGPDWIFWSASDGAVYPELIHLPFKNITLMSDINKSRIEGKKSGQGIYSKRQKNAFFKHLNSHISLSKKRLKYILDTPGACSVWAMAKRSGLHVNKYHDGKFSEEEQHIVSRFADVFDQAYTRFLDLQKAEAQAREAQIEAALERVRASSMAMHRSEELFDVVTLVFDQLSLQGIEMDTCMIIEYHEDSRDWLVWAAAGGQNYSDQILIPYLKHDLYDRLENARRKGLNFLKDSFTKAQKDEWFTQIFTNSTLITVPEDRKKYVYDSEGLSRSVVLTKNVSFTFFRYSLQSFSASENDLFKRFARVFEQAYARFLDLQKAEAQAKEAQIEAALERVRSRTMAMHQSSELAEVASVLFNEVHQLYKLSENQFRCWIVIADEEKEINTVWSTDKLGIPLDHKSFIPIKEHPVQRRIYKEWKAKKEFVTTDFTGPQAVAYTDYLMQFEGYKEDKELASKISQYGKVKSKNKLKYPKPRGKVVAQMFESFFKFGRIGFLITDELVDIDMSLMNRFSNVFEQTYTRFLDLQKAEAQAREAQIEAALERVRAASMAMHKTEEIEDVVVILFQQLKELKLEFYQSWISVIHLDQGYIDVWMSPLEGFDVLPFYMKLPTDLVDGTILKLWKEGKEFNFQSFIKKDALNEMFKGYDSIINQNRFSKIQEVMQFERLEITDAIHHYGLLSISTENVATEEEKEIIKRFGKVFQQCYTRFSDLQKAEAQAREAQIEAALERVRSASMAMHNSDELVNVATIVYHQLLSLGFEQVVSGGFLLPIAEEGIQKCWFSETDSDLLEVFSLPYSGDPILDERLENWEKKIPFLEQRLSPKQLKKHFEYIFPENTRDQEVQEAINSMPSLTVFNMAFFKHGYINLISNESLTSEQQNILIRFTNVFEQTYTRFLDLQKAEAQTREALIETALERVRAKAMAMHSSQDLSFTVDAFFSELELLDVKPRRCGVGIIDRDTRIVQVSASAITDNNKTEIVTANLTLTGHPVLNEIFERFLVQKEYQPILRGKEIQKYYQVMNPEVAYPDIEENETEYGYYFFFKEGGVFAWTNEELSKRDTEIFRRFNSVLSLTYRRYIDLLEAEAQAREAKIEAALERVRAKTMAMHNSDELAGVMQETIAQIQLLEIETDVCAINLFSDSKDWHIWVASPEQNYAREVHIPYFNHPMFQNSIKAIEEKKLLVSIPLNTRQLKRWYEHIFKHSDFGKLTNAKRKKVLLSADSGLMSIAFGKYSFLLVGKLNDKPYSNTDLDAFKRFAKVFDQAYRRFLDLQKAEGQAREAQIEAALERVRARTMAMHQSDELSSVINHFYQELVSLDVQLDRCLLLIVDPTSEDITWWIAGKEGLLSENGFLVKNNRYKSHKAYIEGWKSKRKKWVYILEGREKKTWDTFAFNKTGLANVPEVVKADMSLIKRVHLSISSDSFGNLKCGSLEPLTDHQQDIISRFASGFNITYTRFLDLQKAERRAQEAEIEASMERVRSRAMAMHKTDELNEVVGVIFDELKNLGFEAHLCSIGIYDRETKGADWWSFIEGHDVPGAYHYPYLDGRWFREVYEAWIEQKPYHYIEMFGKEKDKHTKLSFEFTDWKYLSDKIKDTLVKTSKDGIKASYVSMKKGMLEIVTYDPLTQDQIKLLQRFTKVIDLTYTRVDDLEQAEAREKEAQQQASLDRVRAEIASMRNAEDLQEITPLIWRELILLDIPFFRCGFFIMSERLKEVRVYLANAQGEAVTTLNIPYDSTEYITGLVANWRKQEIYMDQWTPEQFTAFFKSMMQQGILSESTLDQEPPELLHLQFFPFQQGMFYIGSETRFEEDQQATIQRMALTFQDAYTRYQDFQKLARARKSAEDALNELESTQDQLVQAEKMASLGELTAGIAHEIKNPLNFVNNFSEVNAELADELIEELENQDFEEAKAIANDIKSNQEKILHHGKRADSIVKNMLQHSRSGSGEKQATDINALADEYLRLAYHGLRAKDSNFNCKMETDLDDTIGKVEVIPQDFGRVLLNLITNAFQACAERVTSTSLSDQFSTPLSDHDVNYKPTIVVSSRRLSEAEVEIRVSDNGNGIPEEIKDKIFQPFFTTKPTGEGTGLGLSMSYDIVTKGHGGTLEVESKEGEGTEFIVRLPVA